MSDALDRVYRSVEEQHADKSRLRDASSSRGRRPRWPAWACWRRPGWRWQRAVAVMGWPDRRPGRRSADDPERGGHRRGAGHDHQHVGFEKGLGGDAVTQRNIKAAAREELVHYQVLFASGGQPVTKRIWVPDAVFASRTGLLNTLQGDQIFVNAYLIATKTSASARPPTQTSTPSFPTPASNIRTSAGSWAGNGGATRAASPTRCPW